MKKSIILGLLFAAFVVARCYGVFWWTLIGLLVICGGGAWLYWLGWEDCKAEERRQTLMRMAHPAAKIPCLSPPPAAPVEMPAKDTGPRHWVFPKSQPKRKPNVLLTRKSIFTPRPKKSLFNKPLHGK